MFIPIGTERATKSRPVVTQALVGVNVAVYLIGLLGHSAGFFESRDVLANLGHLDPRDFAGWQLVSYQFLHNPHGIMHILFNMIFLWVFGLAVEDRLGRSGFLAFYLLGGVLAGLAHMWTSEAPVIGASGSVAAVSGAFLALFPRTRIKVLVIFIFIGVFMIPSAWFIGLFFVLDLMRAFGGFLGGGQSNIAYMAHLGGYIYGFGVAIALLGFGVLKHTEFDALYLFKQSRRRAAFRATQKQASGGMWDVSAARTEEEKPKQVHVDRSLTPAQKELSERRAAITRLIEQHQLEEAGRRFIALLESFPQASLGEQQLLDIGSALYAAGEYEHAARIYERMLERYPRSREAVQVRLMLGMIYLRQLDQPEKARTMIETARSDLSEQSQRDLADQLLGELES